MGRDIDTVIAGLSPTRKAKIAARTKEIIMESKQTGPKRNPFVKLALFRKAGSHRKTNKQMRAQLKRDTSSGS